jgi:hypothetical protein
MMREFLLSGFTLIFSDVDDFEAFVFAGKQADDSSDSADATDTSETELILPFCLFEGVNQPNLLLGDLPPF